jgi:hypothetical protein
LGELLESAVVSGEGPSVQEYLLLGIEKIARQAARDPTTIRCPRDGAVMRVLGERAPASGEPLDLECPACRRRAVGVRPADPTAPPPVP